jgi:uncharacterized protein YqgQ
MKEVLKMKRNCFIFMILVFILITLTCGCVDMPVQMEIKDTSQKGEQVETEVTSQEGKQMETEDTSQEGEQMETEVTYMYEEGIFEPKDWENIQFPIKDDCIPDKETAIKVAKIFLENLQKQNFFTNNVLGSVFYDTEDKIWIVSFWEESDYMLDGYVTVGGDLSIAIRRENAEVVKMWPGE